MSNAFFSDMSSWIPRLFGPSDAHARRSTAREVDEASTNACTIQIFLINFKREIQKRFPHRAEAIALTNKVNQVLYQQHGGMSAFSFLHKWEFGHFNNSVALPEHERTLEMILNRWKDVSEVDEEFKAFRAFDNPPGYRNLTEARISEISVFMREWLQRQRVGSLPARAHID